MNEKARALIRLLLVDQYTNAEIVDKFRVDGLAPTLRDQREVGELVDLLRADQQEPRLPERAEDGSSPEPMLPGSLLWSKIESTYRRLANEAPSWGARRRHPGEPSRPETARALDVSTPTLKRACKAAGRGTRWPPTEL